ncbi:MAG: zinc ribbon domain-containing protein [Omnitrophica bacterium]|nr:zinc ribbon domain-containing protein [Candidatus Omnitrophota bacterium]
MPTYEYKCKKCKHKFDAFQQITAKPLKSCPECKGPVYRLISSGAGFIFKGSGFYTTDYRSKEYKEKQSQETKAKGPCPASDNNQACKKCPLKKNGQ